MAIFSSYKYDRDNAYNDVRACKQRIGEIKDNIGSINDQIREIRQRIGSSIKAIKDIKADRTRMYDLKKEGYSKGGLKNDIWNQQSDLEQMQLKLKEQELLREEFVNTKKREYGYLTFQNELELMKTEKSAFIRTFDLQDNHHKRVNEHRAKWLKERNLA